jgi:hypothetical protein
MIPGRALHRIAARICSAKTLERVAEAAIADLQKEYAGSADRHLLRRGWILLVGYSAIMKAMGMCALSAGVATEEERSALRKTCAWSLTFMVAATGLLLLPPLWSVERGAGLSSVLVQSIPQAVPLAIPIGLTFGMAVGFAGRSPTRAIAKIVLLMALAASLVNFVTLAWVMPAANQSMTLSELHREIETATARGDTRSVQLHSWSYHTRFALSVATLVLAAFALATAHCGRGALIALAACFGYWGLLYSGHSLFGSNGHLFAMVAAWLPNVVFALVTWLVVSWRQRLSHQTA